MLGKGRQASQEKSSRGGAGEVKVARSSVGEGEELCSASASDMQGKGRWPAELFCDASRPASGGGGAGERSRRDAGEGEEVARSSAPQCLSVGIVMEQAVKQGKGSRRRGCWRTGEWDRLQAAAQRNRKGKEEHEWRLTESSFRGERGRDFDLRMAPSQFFS